MGIRRWMKRAAVGLAVMLAGCSHYRPTNAPLDRYDASTGYRLERMGDDRENPVILMLAFSGGGTRAAALAYGVLEELRDTWIQPGGERSRLLDHVDMISSVSGGSFASAYYGLFGERIFEDFEARFLKRNIQGRLILELLRPRNWLRMMRAGYDRTELAIELYDREVFEEKSFSDLADGTGPIIQINATDLGVGYRFPFIQGQFDLMCSDLSSLQVARAVAASSAVPLVFPPITLRNYAGQCGFVPPPWLEASLAEPHRARRFYNAQIVASYLDADERPYIHLVDGGISDNLGARAQLDNLIALGSAGRIMKSVGVRSTYQIALILVNAETTKPFEYNRRPAAPSLRAIVSSITGSQIHRQNFETVALLRERLDVIAADVPPSPSGDPVGAHFVEVSFDDIADPDERRFFDEVPTSFNLPDESVDRLREVGRRLLRDSEDYQNLLEALGARELEARDR